MYRIEGTENGAPVDVEKLYLKSGGNLFASRELAQAVVDVIGRTRKRFRVVPEGEAFRLVGEVSIFDADRKETVEQINMRAEVEPCVWDDEAVAAKMARRMNSHYAGPTLTVVELEATQAAAATAVALRAALKAAGKSADSDGAQPGGSVVCEFKTTKLIVEADGTISVVTSGTDDEGEPALVTRERVSVEDAVAAV